LAYSFDAKETSLFDRLALVGGVPKLNGGDYLSVTNANANPDKIDAYLSRSIDDRVKYNARSGVVDTEVTVTLRNAAPVSGLPDYVIGNFAGLPKGTNHTLLSVYSGLKLESATLDGVTTSLEPQVESDRNRYSRFIDIPSQSTAVLRLRLRGRVRPRAAYELTYLAQPVANADQLRLHVDVSTRQTVERAKFGGSAYVPEVHDSGGVRTTGAATLTGGVATFRVPVLTVRHRDAE